MLIEGFEKDINNSLNGKTQVKRQKPLRGTTGKLNKTGELIEKKTIQDLKMTLKTIKKSQRETTMNIENLGKKSAVLDPSINNRIQQIEERISGAKDTIESIETTVNENEKCKKHLTQNIQEIKNKIRRPNLRITGMEESEDFQLKGPVNVFN